MEQAVETPDENRTASGGWHSNLRVALVEGAAGGQSGVHQDQPSLGGGSPAFGGETGGTDPAIVSQKTPQQR